MKLIKLIEKLTSIKNEYLDKCGTEPEIFSFDDEGIHLCSKVERPERGVRRAKKPYLTRKTGLENFL